MYLQASFLDCNGVTILSKYPILNTITVPFNKRIDTLNERFVARGFTAATILVILFPLLQNLQHIIYSRVQAKWCTSFVVLARLLSHSGCSNAYDNHVWSHTHQLLPIAPTETPIYGHRTLGNTNFCLRKKLWYYLAL